MNIIVERDRLKDALRIVVSQTKGTKIPILTHLLLDAEDSKLRIVGHALDSCSQVTIPAEVDGAGTIAIPGERFGSVIAGLPSGSQVSIEGDTKVGKVKCGRSIYQFSLLPASDFPDMLEPKDAVSFVATAQQIKQLFDQPAPCISKEANRPYIQGIYLHKRGKRLSACATDGHTLARISVDLEPPTFDGVIVPENSCGEIVKVAGDDEATLQISRELLAISSGDRLFVSKLIDGTFPDYDRVIPQSTAVPIALDCKELDAALTRIVAAQDDESRGDVIKIAWNDNPEAITVSLRSQTGEGHEEIDCDSGRRPAGEVGLQCHYLRRLIEVTGGENIRLLIDGPGDAIRLENPATDSIVTVCMPCRF